MNRTFRTVSALLRQAWLIEESFAQAHEPLINAYLSGQLADVTEEHKTPIGYFLSGATRLSRSGRTRVPAALGPADADAARQHGLAGDSPALVRHELAADTELPENSVFVLDIRGVIMKSGSCFSYGTEDYVQFLNAAYANPNVIGVVCLVDSPGGQLSGTPSLFDAIRNPIKPTVSVVSEGLMASAAFWLACGSDFIYASQQTDQIGSIGVFVQLRDASEAMAKAGFKTITVYSERSSEKNKPVRDALSGDTKLLVDDLNQAADLFRAAVESGRGNRLKPATKDVDVFKGGLYYAGQAIELGLIDGYGDLNTAVAKVYELSQARKNAPLGTPGSALTLDAPAPLMAQTASALLEAIPPAPSGPALPESNSNPNQTNDDMFGDKHKKLTSLAGVEASAITDEVLNEINANLDTHNITGARVISAAYLQEAEQAIAQLATATTNLATANAAIITLTTERDNARSDAQKFGSQPGHLGTKSEKVDEKTAGSETTNANPFYSETDAARDALKAQMQQ